MTSGQSAAPSGEKFASAPIPIRMEEFPLPLKSSHGPLA